ncbi:hypothetical protein F5879DRAFT_365191 [Lentinula edodes]|nr:hypothetical protein F5879DRAFT_365191 [Lentinula edodes]
MMMMLITTVTGLTMVTGFFIARRCLSLLFLRGNLPDEMDAAEAAKNRERKRKKGKSQGEEWQPQPQQVLFIFDEDTLGGHFPYKNMVFIMHQFCGKELETRSVEWQEMVQKQKQLQTERTGTDGMAQDG